MILNLNKFIKSSRDTWSELESFLVRFDRDPETKLDFHEIQRFHYLYQKTSADLAKLSGLSARQDIRIYLESIVARSYSIIHAASRPRTDFKPLDWFFNRLPNTFRRHIAAFWLAAAILAAGSIFGSAVLIADPAAKPSVMPFAHLLQNPAERVATEEGLKEDRMTGRKAGFASYLITHNTRVAFLAFSLGITWGTGTVLIVFSNGIGLGATIADYIHAGQSEFLVAWLLPHGSIEIPAILLAAQAGFILAGAMIGLKRRCRPLPLKNRFQKISRDLFTLMGGVCLMLLWAGFVEAFLSQYHEPFLSYPAKILFGIAQLSALVIFFSFSGRKRSTH